MILESHDCCIRVKILEGGVNLGSKSTRLSEEVELVLDYFAFNTPIFWD